ncbi:uncharacterized protein LOC127840647 [Dreissena polymorpha]|uniref:Claudin n=1 Tax=Dreissena polymorpha TaxID=45954 RepID=A0A9D4N0M4_DREPO|nr:uncharacterized protein LOC127840647 [Dreissena polymorpha]KAH3885625.1 hypothetical protein DPMN_009620 [Dreissena polymorpha]
MQCSPFRMLVIVLAIFSIGFHLTGIIAPAWLRMSMEIHTDLKDSSVEVHIGLWFNIICQNGGMAKDCVTMFTFGNMDSDGETPAMNFEVIKALVMTGESMCLLGFVLVLIHFHRENNLNPSQALAVLAALVFFVCALIVFGAVGIQGYRNQTFVDTTTSLYTSSNGQISFEIYFPWALLVSGIGAALALFAAMAVSIHVCCYKPQHRGDVVYSANYTSSPQTEPMY